MKLRSVLFLLSVVLSVTVLAVPINQEDALLTAQQFYSKAVKIGLRQSVKLNLVYADTCNKATTNAFVGFYVFNAGTDNGFVMVSGDNAVRPILAYSDNGSFPSKDMPENLVSWLEQYRNEIEFAVKRGVTFQETTSTQASVVVPPLLTCTWDQQEPYNLLCPIGPITKERAVVGCVATAMAQIMYYHRWPITGTGEHSYNYRFELTKMTFSANFGATTYNWDAMRDHYDGTTTAAQDSAVALLSYHCGVACDMMYGTSSMGGSSAYGSDAGMALINYFGYDQDANMLFRYNYTADAWNQRIKDELDAKRPVMYGGSSNSGGHEFVCDGYDSNDYFHINWGWSGDYNGFFSLTTLDPSSSDLYSDNGYTYYSDVVVGIQKPDSVSKAVEHQLMVYNTPLSSSMRSISDVETDSLTVTFSCANYGMKSFYGDLGICLYQQGVFINYLSKEDTLTLEPYMWLDGDLTLSLAGLSDGDYELAVAYRSNESLIWSKVGEMGSTANSLLVNISGNKATINPLNTEAKLALTGAVTLNGSCYTNRNCSMTLPLKNEGNEFYSYLSVAMQSTEKQSRIYYSSNALVQMDQGETKNIEFNTFINAQPGLYKAYILYDASNTMGDDFKLVGDTFLITVLPEPSAPIVQLVGSPVIEGDQPLYTNSSFNLQATMKNVGGYFNDNIVGLFFEDTTQTYIAQFGNQTVVLDTNETKTVSLSGAFPLNPGTYYFGVYYLYNGIYNRLKTITPTDTVKSAYLPILVSELPIGLHTTTTAEVSLASNPVSNNLEIRSEFPVVQVTLYDIRGVVVGTYSHSTVIPVNHLATGNYLIRVITTKGTTLLRFVKK